MRGMKVFVIATVMLTVWVLCAGAGEIHEAVVSGDVDRVATLLKRDPGLVNAPDETDQFASLPLHLAAIQGNVEIARLLLEGGAYVDCGDSDESTPLHNAGLNRHPEMVAFLLENGADVNRRDRNGAYALSFAASGGDEAVVQQILDAGSDLNYWQAQGMTLFHFACSRNLRNLFDALVAHGEDINLATETGVTPMHWAAMRNQAEMIELMLEHGAEHSPADEHGDTPLANAAFRNSADAARALLAAGADPNVRNTNEDTPLHMAAWTGNTDVARVLLEYGADVDAEEDNGLTPLVSAVRTGDPDLVEALLANGATVGASDKRFGFSVLHMAAMLGYGDVAEHLLGHGASITSRDNEGNSPLDLAVRYGHGDVAELLKSHGASGKIPSTYPGSLAVQGEVAEGEAVVWYLGHSGWAVKTRNHFLVFDYFNMDRDPAAPALCNGRVCPAELKDERVTVFATHEHGDHYNPLIFDWKDELPRVTYVLGCQPEEAPPYEFMEGRQTKAINGMRVVTIESNDTGVGFVIEVDGLVVFHAGDHANRHQDFSGPYRAEIDYLAAEGIRPDIAFMPISGCGFGDQVAVKMGVHYAIETLKPMVFIPMHSGGNPYRYHEFISDCRDKFPDTDMRAVTARGDHFRYRDGRTS